MLERWQRNASEKAIDSPRQFSLFLVAFQALLVLLFGLFAEYDTFVDPKVTDPSYSVRLFG